LGLEGTRAEQPQSCKEATRDAVEHWVGAVSGKACHCHLIDLKTGKKEFLIAFLAKGNDKPSKYFYFGKKMNPNK
jgi:hypothetical protein